MDPGESSTWTADWAWGLPLIVVNSVVHVLGLGLISERVMRRLESVLEHRHFLPLFAVAMSVMILLATLLHALEAILWAAAYLLLGAVPDVRSAMLYSLSALTTYGHTRVVLAPHWRMMGALEALNGIVLFGLTTAFLFAMIQQVRPLGRRDRHPRP